MSVSLIVSIGAVLSLLPAALLPYRRIGGRDGLFWLLLAVAAVGVASAVAVLFGSGWRNGLGGALWATAGAGLASFALVSALSREAWRLAALMFPYLSFLGALATVWLDVPARPLAAGMPGSWTAAHIVFALLAYGLLTVGAVAGAAVVLQERALKGKHPTRLSGLLLSIADGDRLQTRMLQLGALSLSLGLATGFASHYGSDGRLASWDHKTVLSLGALVVIAGLLGGRILDGMRGGRAARLAMLAYLLLTLAYPGVKFVTDVLVG